MKPLRPILATASLRDVRRCCSAPTAFAVPLFPYFHNGNHFIRPTGCFPRRLYSSSPSRSSRGSPFSMVEIPLDPNLPPLKFHAIWLRDHCRCPLCWHPITQQRLVDTSKIERTIRVTSVLVNGNGSVDIKWSDNHSGTFDGDWLRQNEPQLYARFPQQDFPIPMKLWGNKIATRPPSLDFEQARYGFSFVHNVPISVEKTRLLAERICFMRETHYGTYWDFQPDLEHGDTAYTSIALPAHTDTTYFSDPIGLQLFHLLQSSGSGGETLLVDGFNVAHQLKKQRPDAYKVLRETKVASHCAGDESTYIYPTPRYQSMFTEDEHGALIQVRYNNNDRSVLNHLSHEQVEQYYDALLDWQALLKKPCNEYWHALVPGTVVVMNNHRVLHGRAAFTGSDRRLTGCYINNDDWRSRLRTLMGQPRSV